MLDMLGGFGEKVAKLFGEPDICGKTSGRREALESIFDHENFTQILPYESYDRETGVFLQEQSLGFVLEINPLVGCDQTAERVINSIFTDILDEGGSIQCLLWADHRIGRFLEHWTGARKTKEILRSLAEKRAQFIKVTPLATSRIFRLILSYSRRKSQDKKSDLKQVRGIKERITQALSSISLCYEWEPKDLVESLTALTHHSSNRDVENWKWNPYQSLSSQISAGGGLNVEKNCLEIETDSKFQFKSFRTVQVPEEFYIGKMDQLIGDILRDNFRIHSPFFLHYGVHKPFQNGARNRFWRKAQNIENQGRSSTLVRMIPKLADELDECDYVRRSIDQGESLVETHLSVGVWAPEGDISKASQEIQGIFKINNFKLAENAYLHLPELFWSLPMTWADSVQVMRQLSLLKTTLDSECPYFAPLHGEWYGTRSPGMMMFGRRGQIMSWNPFDSAGGNYNCVVVGRSGAGKSVFMQDMLVSGLSTGARVYVLDVGRSFERVCDLLEGQKIEFSRKTDICLNPFSNIVINNHEDREDALSCLKSVISCMAAPQHGTDDYETSLIESAISSVWEQKGNRSTVTDISDWLKSQSDEIARRLGVMLTPYTRHGVYSKYFEGKNNVNFTNPMVLIELEELKEKKDLQTVVLQIFMLNITQHAFMGDRKTRCYICIDEAWDLLRAKQTEVFIETLARRIRKYGGSLVVGTQNISDFFSAPGANSAYKNSEWTCILAQKKSAVEEAINTGQFSASDAMKNSIDSLTTKAGEYAEIMICDSQQNYSIERLILDPFSQLLYTTKAEEFARIKELRNRGCSVVEAIEEIERELEGDGKENI